jgi:tetratricopeptide (TPR) repeat protein
LGALVDRAREALAVLRKHKGERCAAVLQARYQLGRLLVPLWHLDEAAPLVEGLVPICREILGEQHPLHAGALESLGRLRMCQGELREAEDLIRRALTLTVAALGERRLEVASRHRWLGNVLQAENRLTAAAESYEQALEILRDVLGEEHPQVADLRIELAEIRENVGEHCKAVEQMRTVIEMLDRSPEDVRPEQPGACLALARLQAGAGDLDEAGTLARRAASLAREIGTDPFLYVPAVLLEARIVALQGKPTEAGKFIDLAEKALAGLPPNHPMRLETSGARASMARLKGDPARAVRLAREAVNRFEKNRGERSPCLAAALSFLAEQLHYSGELVESEKVYERLLDLQRARRGQEHPDVAATLRGLAQLHLSRGNAAAAEVRFREALEIRRGGLGDRHPLTAESLCDLAWLLYKAGNLVPADAMFRNALEACHEGLGATHPDTLTARRGLALVALARGAPTEAAFLLEEGLSLVAADHPQKLDLEYALASVYHARGESARARKLLEEILRVNEKTLGENHEALIPVLTDLAQVQSGLGCRLEARELLERIRSIRSRSPYPDPLGQALDLVNLADSHRLLNDTDRAAELAQQARGYYVNFGLANGGIQALA